MDTTIFKYKNAIEINDFIDFLYSQKIIDELNYYTVYARVSRFFIVIVGYVDSSFVSACWRQAT